MSTLGERLEVGRVSEDQVADYLRKRGYCVDLFGARVWHETGSLVAKTWHRVRHAPDLLVASPRHVFFVEVVYPAADGYECRAMGLAKMRAADAFAELAPYVFVDWASRLAWPHSPNWPHRISGNAHPPTTTAPGLPFALFRREGERPLDEMFGGVA